MARHQTTKKRRYAEVVTKNPDSRETLGPTPQRLDWREQQQSGTIAHLHQGWEIMTRAAETKETVLSHRWKETPLDDRSTTTWEKGGSNAALQPQGIGLATEGTDSEEADVMVIKSESAGAEADVSDDSKNQRQNVYVSSFHTSEWTEDVEDEQPEAGFEIGTAEDVTNTSGQYCQCQLCGLGFLSKFFLQQHIRSEHIVIETPDGTRPSLGQGSSIGTSLGTDSEFPYVCQYCNKGFNVRPNLKRHLTVHTGEKPYFCNICGKSFPRQMSLTVHRRTHTGEKPYCCKLCGKTFAASSNYCNHMKKVHRV